MVHESGFTYIQNPQNKTELHSKEKVENSF